MVKTEKARAEALARFRSGWRPQRILTDNTKLEKAEKFGRRTLGLSLAPADVSGFEVCHSRSESCTEHCIFTSGRGLMDMVMMARIFRTLWYFHDRDSFMKQLFKEIYRNQDASIRLNVFSDIVWERKFPEIFEEFSNVQFYDYTKHGPRMFQPRPANYHLTFSLHEQNQNRAREVLDAGMNVAAVTQSVEGTLFGYPVIDGDEHDLRFLDPSPCVVGLIPKGSLKSSAQQEMVYALDQPHRTAA